MIFARTVQRMVLTVVRSAKPPDIPRAAIIIMVGVNLWIAAYFAIFHGGQGHFMLHSAGGAVLPRSFRAPAITR